MKSKYEHVNRKVLYERIKSLRNAIQKFIDEHEGRKAIQPTWNDKHIEKFKELLKND
jgi:hypothetical protein